jgi:signal transduction histidine kinase
MKKHSGADRGEVKLEIDRHMIHVSIRYNGVGFDRESVAHKGLGVRSMEERAHMLGGAFKVHSRPDGGTQVEAWVPVEPLKRKEM